jgi:hypothetical protein
MSLLAAWNGFYVIVGSAAAALTGLQFIAIVLGAEGGIGNEKTIRAFGSPTIVHFCAAVIVRGGCDLIAPAVRRNPQCVGCADVHCASRSRRANGGDAQN